jgi:hypothetical protein
MKKLLAILLLTAFIACEKGPGEGGTSKIRGKVYGYNYNSTFTFITDSGYVPDEDVYIIYGDEKTFDDDQKTNYDGTYEFRYLRKGKYTLYVYSDDSLNGGFGIVPVIQTIEITDNRSVLEMPDFKIIK